jgi:phosphopantetheinyl transferase
MAMSWLPVDERPLVTRFKFKRDQHLALSSLLLRRHYFSNLLDIGWYELQFDRLSGGKPILVSVCV